MTFQPIGLVIKSKVVQDIRKSEYQNVSSKAAKESSLITKDIVSLLLSTGTNLPVPGLAWIVKGARRRYFGSVIW